jgi:hypothetical protein
VIAKGRIACRGDAISLLEQLNREGLTYGFSTSTHGSDQNTQVGES